MNMKSWYTIAATVFFLLVLFYISEFSIVKVIFIIKCIFLFQNTGKFRRVCKFFIFWHSYTSNPELIAQCFRHFCSSCFWRPKPESEISGRGPLTLSNLCLVEYVCGEIENSQKTLFLRGQRLSTQKGRLHLHSNQLEKDCIMEPQSLGSQ